MALAERSGTAAGGGSDAQCVAVPAQEIRYCGMGFYQGCGGCAGGRYSGDLLDESPSAEKADACCE